MKRSIALLVTIVAVVVGASLPAQAAQSESRATASTSITLKSNNGSASIQAICYMFPRMCRW